MPQPTDQLTDLSLADLFTESDRIGDKYLTDDEIETRDRDLGQEIDAANRVRDGRLLLLAPRSAWDRGR